MMIVDKTTDKDQEVIQFLTKHSKGHFDTDFILRLSLRYERYGVSICIYSEISLYEEAVSLALKHGRLQEAKKVATTVEDPDIKKTLWLDIAAAMIKQDLSLIHI